MVGESLDAGITFIVFDAPEESPWHPHIPFISRN